MLKAELNEQPRKLLVWVDEMVMEQDRVQRPVDPKDVDIAIPSGLTSQHDAAVRTLGRSLPRGSGMCSQ